MFQGAAIANVMEDVPTEEDLNPTEVVPTEDEDFALLDHKSDEHPSHFRAEEGICRSPGSGV